MTRSDMRCLLGWRSAGVLSLLAVFGASVVLAQDAPVVPKQLRLADAIKIALGSSTQLGTDQAALDAAGKAKTAAWFNLGPDLRISGTRSSNTRKDFDKVSQVTTLEGEVITTAGDTIKQVPVKTATVVADVTEESTFKQGQLTSSIRLFDGFANINRVRAASQDQAASGHNLEYTRKRVQESVISAYYNLLRAKLLLRVAEEGETVAKDQLDRTQALYELGSAARSDVLKSQVQHGQTRLVLVRARNNVRQTHVDLEYAMNLTMSADFDIDTTVVIDTVQVPAYEGERDYAMAHRDNLLAARARERAAQVRTGIAKGALLPSVDFQYAYSMTRQTSEFRLGASKNDNRQWALFGSWNLWDRYQNYANIAEARAAARTNEYARKQAELDAVREIRQLVNSMDEARERFAVARENVVRSREDLRLAQEKFRVGAGTILDTITAESDLTLTRASVVEAGVDYLIARANLTRATGREFTEQ